MNKGVLVVGGLVVVAGGAGLVYYYRKRLGIGGGTGALSAGGSGPGWTAGSDVQLTEELGDFLTELAAASGCTLFCTSGVRTAEDQARAMLAKMTAGNDISDLLALYKRDDLVQELAAIPQTLSAWMSILQQQIDRGDLLSSHMSGRAVDLRSAQTGTGHLTDDEQDRVVAAAKDLGASVVIEDTPAHIHLELGGWFA